MADNTERWNKMDYLERNMDNLEWNMDYLERIWNER